MPINFYFRWLVRHFKKNNTIYLPVSPCLLFWIYVHATSANMQILNNLSSFSQLPKIILYVHRRFETDLICMLSNISPVNSEKGRLGGGGLAFYWPFHTKVFLTHISLYPEPTSMSLEPPQFGLSNFEYKWSFGGGGGRLPKRVLHMIFHFCCNHWIWSIRIEI